LEKDERQIAEWYNTLSDSYDELYGEEQSRKYETILRFFGNRHFEVLIDIGCGTGNFLQKASEIYDHAIGIDLSARMLRIAISRKIANTDYVLASSSSLPLKNSSSDCTVSISTAKAGSNSPGFIADLRRISREDSLLAFTLFQEPGLPNPETLVKPMRSIMISERETLYFLRLAREIE
jgi:ubiquinone/menaquinone biosynthesis C-methylase UbiE